VDKTRGTAEEHEARGLLGRINKQLYVNRRANKNVQDRAFLGSALREYLAGYRAQPTANLWHGVNAVALAEMARRDGLDLAESPDAARTAKDILDVLGQREARSTESLSTWDLATGMEASLALRDSSEAVRLALEYVESPGADAFEINSTLRQMTEIWGLSDLEMPGSQLLPILRSALVRKEGGTVTLGADEANAELNTEAGPGLEAIFGANRFQTLKWYQLGLERAKSVARIENLSGQGHGTGWLVRGEDFFPDQAGKLLVITNHHVISDPPFFNALRPHQTRANFQMQNVVLEMDRIVWSSPLSGFDVTLLSLKAQPDGLKPLELAAARPEMRTPASRLYLIGHPAGRDLEFSLQDSQLIGMNDRLIHYRSPTEAGSSGSPVFEDQEWKVVGLHHAGRGDMPRLDGKPGTYEANEALSIHEIRTAIASIRTAEA
jgi:hypothetical protein